MKKAYKSHQVRSLKGHRELGGGGEDSGDRWGSEVVGGGSTTSTLVFVFLFFKNIFISCSGFISTAL